MKPQYSCPVCGFKMDYAPRDFNICPSCGTEFGYSDAGRTYDELREEWKRLGMPWHSHYYKQPRNWDPQLQLILAGLLPPLISAEADNDPREGIPVLRFVPESVGRIQLDVFAESA